MKLKKCMMIYQLIKEKNDSTPNLEVRVISFQKEEAFLEALKRLQQELG